MGWITLYYEEDVRKFPDSVVDLTLSLTGDRSAANSLSYGIFISRNMACLTCRSPAGFHPEHVHLEGVLPILIANVSVKTPSEEYSMNDIRLQNQDSSVNIERTIMHQMFTIRYPTYDS